MNPLISFHLFRLNHFSHANGFWASKYKHIQKHVRGSIHSKTKKRHVLMASLYENLGDLDILKEYSKNAQFFQSHQEYESVLKLYDSVLSFEFDTKVIKTFIGSGSGRGALNSYRKIDTLGQVVFEKVYFNQDIQGARIAYFHLNIYDQLKGKINIPELKNVVRGNLLTVVYTTWVNLSGRNYSFLELIEQYLEFNDAFKTVKIPLDIPDSLKLEHNLIFRKAKKSSQIELQRRSYGGVSDKNFEEFTNRILNSGLVQFAHGDVHYNNVFENNYLIDWDECGFYPAHYDFGLLLSRYRIKKASLIEHIVTVYLAQSSFIELFHLYYFTFIFSIHQRDKKSHSEKYLMQLGEKVMEYGALSRV